MDLHTKLLLKNHAWSAQIKREDPTFFQRQAKSQHPRVLWIGCADSRTPAEVIVDSDPGDIFLHRNIAAQVSDTDSSVLAVLQYAVDYLNIDEIIVCGHYKCGGIEAAVNGIGDEHLGDWLGNIRRVLEQNRDKFPDPAKSSDALDLFVHFVVIDQVKTLSRLKTVTNAWKANRKLRLHGWVYRLSEGLATELITLTKPAEEGYILTPPGVGRPSSVKI
jgi:carbonic anhydrase